MNTSRRVCAGRMCAVRVAARRVCLLLAVLACSLVWGAAGAAAVGDFSIVDLPDDPGAETTPMARSHLTAAAVEARVQLDPGMRSAQIRRPGARIVLRYDEVSHRWIANLTERGSDTYLASVIVDDVTGRIVATRALPVGAYPSQLVERGAIDIAVADREAARTAKRWGGMGRLRASGTIDDGTWDVDFFDPHARHGDRSEPVMRVQVADSTGEVVGVWTGIQIAWGMARGDRYAFGGSANDPGAWLPFFVLFGLVAIDWTRPRRAFTIDVLAVLALGVSHELFLEGHIHGSVPLALPPLLWLLGRSVWIFLRGMPRQVPAIVPRRRLTKLAMRRVPTIALIVFCVALAGVRIGVAYDGGNVIDVGYAGVAGARLELQGRAPWGNMPADNPHGDTYGPANYLAYVPATATVDDVQRDLFGHPLRAAQATSIAADLGCVLLLMVIGWRWISRRGAWLLAAGWLACPWTFWAMASGVNDALVALPLLAAFAALPRATLRGFLVGLAAMVKFAPFAVLAPLLHAGGRRRLRQSLLAVLGAMVAVAAGLAWVTYRLDHGVGTDLHLFWQRTLAFQTERGSPFSVWGLYGWSTAQHVAQALVALALVAACIVPRTRDAWQVAAGVAAALIASQLVVTHWFYLYVPWFVGFTLLVLVAARERPVPAPVSFAE